MKKTPKAKARFAKDREAVLEFLTAYLGEQGYAPSYREICEGVGIKSTSYVTPLLKSLEDDGYIRQRPRVPRAIALLH